MNNLGTKNIGELEIKSKTPHYLVDFLETSQNYCVGLVDMVDSTKIACKLNQKKLSKYYEIFLNAMAEIIEKSGGFVIKNIGDSLLYYFPESSKISQKDGFQNCLECGMKMLTQHTHINKKLYEENLPSLNYRISVDYGQVTIMKTNYSSNIDVLGTPVNTCTKINHSATKNGLVIGSDLYQMVKKIKKFRYKLINDYHFGLKYMYPVYSVREN